jgi:hypothetical protein
MKLLALVKRPPHPRIVASALSAGRRLADLEYDHTLDHTQAMSRPARVTVTLSAELVEEIDRLERNRSRFIAEAVEHELARRRHEELLKSVRDPHPETVGLADTGLGDWAADLADDEGLVNMEGGTAVRWVGGQGWVKE